MTLWQEIYGQKLIPQYDLIEKLKNMPNKEQKHPQNLHVAGIDLYLMLDGFPGKGGHANLALVFL